jgi:hypothetical protein
MAQLRILFLLSCPAIKVTEEITKQISSRLKAGKF